MKTMMGELWMGLSAPLKAARFLRQRPGLWPLAIMPALITFSLLAGFFYLAWTYSGALFEDLVRLLRLEKTGEQERLLTEIGITVLRKISLFVLWVVLGGTAAILAILVGKIFSAPFNDALSAKVERAWSGAAGSGARFDVMEILRSSWWAVTWEAKKVFLYLLVLLPLLLLNIIPLAGSLLYTVLGFGFNVMFQAFDYLDFPLERRPGPVGPLGFRARGSIVWRHRYAMAGFGLSATVLLLVPLINVFFLPLAVTGATLLYLELEKAEMPPTPVPVAEVV